MIELNGMRKLSCTIRSNGTNMFTGQAKTKIHSYNISYVAYNIFYIVLYAWSIHIFHPIAHNPQVWTFCWSWKSKSCCDPCWFCGCTQLCMSFWWFQLGRMPLQSSHDVHGCKLSIFEDYLDSEYASIMWPSQTLRMVWKGKIVENWVVTACHADLTVLTVVA